MKLVNNRWVDDENNSWSALTNTEEIAQAKSVSLRDCVDYHGTSNTTNRKRTSSDEITELLKDCSSLAEQFNAKKEKARQLLEDMGLATQSENVAWSTLSREFDNIRKKVGNCEV